MRCADSRHLEQATGWAEYLHEVRDETAPTAPASPPAGPSTLRPPARCTRGVNSGDSHGLLNPAIGVRARLPLEHHKQVDIAAYRVDASGVGPEQNRPDWRNRSLH